MTAPKLREMEDFSLSTGGLLYSLFRRLGLADHVFLRAAILMGVAWVPLLVLSAINGVALGGATIPFLRDYGAYGRIVVAIPFLIIAELAVGIRSRDVLRHFVRSDLASAKDLPRLASAVHDAVRQKDSFLADFVIIAVIYTSVGFRSSVLESDLPGTWYYLNGSITPAGWYFIFVAMPVFHFLLLRWLWRLAIWTGLLWRISRLSLKLVSIHPDRMGGLGFLGLGQTPFSVVAFACGAVVSGYMINHIVYDNLALSTATSIMLVYVVLAVVVFIAPILVFTGKLVSLRASGMLKYGGLGEEYARSFEHKWIEGAHTDEEVVLGTSDIQSLADLANSYDVVGSMRMIPVDSKTAAIIAGVAALPMIPVFFVALPFEEIVARLLRILG